MSLVARESFRWMRRTTRELVVESSVDVWPACALAVKDDGDQALADLEKNQCVFHMPRWQQALPKTKYLQCPSFSQLLQSSTMTLFFKSETKKHLKLWLSLWIRRRGKLMLLESNKPMTTSTCIADAWSMYLWSLWMELWFWQWRQKKIMRVIEDEGGGERGTCNGRGVVVAVCH